MPSIAAVSTALPTLSSSPTELLSFGEKWLADAFSERERFERFIRSSKIERRYFVLPIADLLTLGGTTQRAQLFEQHGAELGGEALSRALSATGFAGKDIETLIFTSCSSPVIPSIDPLIAQRCRLRSDILRVPMYQHGCAGGAAGLALAGRLAAGNNTVALCSVELCSLVFRPDLTEAQQLVGAALFGDGSAGVIVQHEDLGLTFVDSRSVLLPGTRHLMGYDLLDDGSALRLDRSLPMELAQNVPQLVQTFLADNALSTADVAWWLFHPGGAKILDFLDQAFELNWMQSRWSREVLANVGNLSSASVLFVLEHFLANAPVKHGDLALLLGVGPGLTIELILFRYLSD